MEMVTIISLYAGWDDGGRKTTGEISVHAMGRPSPSVVALSLEYLIGVLSKTASSRREEKVWVLIQKTREYVECAYQEILLSMQTAPSES